MADQNIIDGKIELLITRLIGDGMLDDQFRQLMRLQNESSPDFLTEVVELFFLESKRRLQTFAVMLGEGTPKFADLRQQVLDFKGSTASFGAKLVTDLCDTLRSHCQSCNLEQCKETLAQQEDALAKLEQRMAVFLQLEGERKNADGAGLAHATAGSSS